MVPIWIAGDDVQLKSKFAMFQVGPRPTKTTMTRPRSFEDDIDFPYLRSSTGFGDMRQRAADVCSPRRAYAGRVKARRADRLGALDRFPEHDRIRAHTDAASSECREGMAGIGRQRAGVDVLRWRRRSAVVAGCGSSEALRVRRERRSGREHRGMDGPDRQADLLCRGAEGRSLDDRCEGRGRRARVRAQADRPGTPAIQDVLACLEPARLDARPAGGQVEPRRWDRRDDSHGRLHLLAEADGGRPRCLVEPRHLDRGRARPLRHLRAWLRGEQRFREGRSAGRLLAHVDGGAAGRAGRRRSSAGIEVRDARRGGWVPWADVRLGDRRGCGRQHPTPGRVGSARRSAGGRHAFRHRDRAPARTVCVAALLAMADRWRIWVRLRSGVGAEGGGEVRQ